MSYSYDNSHISGVHMASIPADAASYYAAYNMGGSERRDSAGNVIPAAAGGQQLSAHGFFHHQPAQHPHPHAHPAQTHQQSPLLHASVSQYHPQQPQQPAQQHHYHHQPPSAHASVTQYHTPQHVGAMGAPPHHAGGDPASAYQPGGFQAYAHQAYHAPHTATFDSSAPIDSASAAALVAGATSAAEHDYSAIGVPTSLQAPSSPTQAAAMHGMSSNNMRFDCILEAPTAAAQKADEPTLTYLNKGQLYNVSLLDKSQSDAFYVTTLRIAFHEDSHRKGAATYWNFWLNQQESPRAARAIELDRAGCIGVVATETRQFDRVSFQWQGRRGAKVVVRFNCLSTDFSRIKGVKGIPLRLHLDTHYALPSAGDVAEFASTIGEMPSPVVSLPPPTATAASHAQGTAAVAALSTPVSPASATNANPLDTQTATAAAAGITSTPTPLACGKLIERCYARVKLFRDKGAERKNKDDQRHLDKLWEKQKTKLALANGGNGSGSAAQQMSDFAANFAPVQQMTSFVEYTMTGDDADAEEPVSLSDLWAAGSASVAAAALESPGSALATPLTGLSSMSLGMPLGGLGPSLASAAVAYMRKRSADDLDILSPNKRPFSPASLASGLATAFVGPNNTELIGVDPTYVPVPRKNKFVLSVYVKYQGEHVYRAVYLERLAIDDLVAKLAQRLEIQATSDVEVVRKTKKGLTVRVDDAVVAQIDDQQDMEVECSFAEDTGKLTIYLHY